MSHMVIYRGSDGKPGYHQTDDIHDAVGFVEQMRNDQGVEHARIFRLEEVVFQYRPYYRVELAESGFGELGSAADTATDSGYGNGSGNGSIHGSGGGSTKPELSITSTGGGGEAPNGNGSSESPAPVTTGSTSPSAPTPSPSASSSSPPASSSSPSAPSTPTPGDDAGGSRRGLFGR